MAAPAHHSAIATSFARLDAEWRSPMKRRPVFYAPYTPTEEEEEQFIIYSTNAQLESVRQVRQRALLSKFEQEFEANAQDLEGTDYMLLKGRVRLLVDALLRINQTYFTIGITSDQSLYGRTHLAAGRGTLHFEILLGSDVDSEEDTFATLYSNKKQQWSIAGDFRSTLSALKQHLGITATV